MLAVLKEPTMPTCRGPHCGREIAFIRVGETLVPVDAPMREEVTRADGTKARAFVAHHSTCPDAALFTKWAKKQAGQHNGRDKAGGMG